MSTAHGFWHIVTLLFAIGVAGSIATVVLFSIELLRVALSKDDTAEDFTPQETTNS